MLSWPVRARHGRVPDCRVFRVADVQALRFVQEPSPAGGARWVHLYAATLLLLVVLPRVVLAMSRACVRRRIARHFPLDLGQPYFRALADRVGASGPAVLRVIPYSFTIDERRDHKAWPASRPWFSANRRS
jgi:hypothetical protein